MIKALQQSINRRLMFVLSGAVISGSLLYARLFHLQILEGNYYEGLVDANRFFTVVLPKERGVLLDRYGGQLVYNEPLYYKLKNPERLYGEQLLIGKDEALQLLAASDEHVGIENTRWYPMGAASAHIVGYTGPVTAEDIAERPRLRAQDTIGKFGLERKYEDMLSGESTKEIYEINALGKKTRLVTTQAGKTGTSLTTTLDPYITQAAAVALGEQTGAVIVQDAETGGLIALVSSPSFDPNLLSKRESNEEQERLRKKQVSELFSHPKQLFFNRAIGGAYPPGSVFKLITALAGLETGSIDESTTVSDEGVLKVGEYSYANWYFSQYGRVEGSISLQKAIARSNDIYFYKAAEFLGAEKLAEFARLFGYGRRTGIELPGESAGFVPSPAWKEEKQGEKWFLGNTYHYGIGQGDLLVTPLQVVQMTQTIANHGSLCQPSLLAMDTKQCKGLGVSEESLNLVLSGMLDACSTGGTAFPFFVWNTTHRQPDLKPYQALSDGAVACKTGTAEFGTTTGDNKKKTHGWFTMILNTENLLTTQQEQLKAATPSAQLTQTVKTDYSDQKMWLKSLEQEKFPRTIVITVLVESDEKLPYREGSRDAAPVAKKIVDWMNSAEQTTPIQPPPNTIAE